MIRRKLPIVPLALVAVAVLVPSAFAQGPERTLLVTLSGGAQVTVTMELPAGIPLSQLKIPEITQPIISIADVTDAVPPGIPAIDADPAAAPTDPAAAPTGADGAAPADPAATPTTTTPAPAATTPAPTLTTPVAPIGGDPANGPQAADDDKPQREAQRTTDETTTKRRKAAADERADRAAAKRRKRRAARPAEPATAAPAPAPSDPTYTLAVPGPAVAGVPNFFIDKFRIPPFLLPIYQAAGIEYGVRWEVLAAINEIETDYGRNLNVSSAGALGWMQFMPPTWRQYGVDANDDGIKDPYNPVDAIFAAARYLKAAGAADDLRGAIFAYNHADWYVDSVVLRARLISGLPANFVGSLTGLTQGRFPVHATATYADAGRRSVDIHARANAPVTAVQDGRIVAMGTSKRLGNYIRLRDAYGNTYTYAHLGSLATEIPVPKPTSVSAREVKRELRLRTAATDDPAPKRAASAGTHTKAAAPAATASPLPRTTKTRLFANPSRANALRAGGRSQILDAGGSVAAGDTYRAASEIYGLTSENVVIKRLEVGSKVIAGTILGRLGPRTSTGAKPHLTFSLRPAGRGAPMIDPKPILDGWKLLESTAIYRAEGRNALLDSDSAASVGQLLLMSKEQLQEKVLQDPSIEIYSAGRADIAAGAVDRRVLATLAFLSASGLRPTVSSLQSGHSYLTTSGNVSEHSSGNAVDIAKINGVPILGHQGPGSITDIAVRRLLALQGTLKPHQIITLETYPGTDNTLALSDHDDHIHVGFQPLDGARAIHFNSVLRPGQWNRLMDRLEKLDNPSVSLRPSKYALAVEPKPEADAAAGSGD